MASTNKTTNLQLNSWLGTDKPTRTDFVNDNSILDEVIHNHIIDTNLHFTTNEKEKLDEPYLVYGRQGTGESTQSITLNFVPKIFIYFLRNEVPMKYDSTNGYTLCNAGIIVNCSGVGFASAGISLNGSTVTVSQSTTATDGVFLNLNKSYTQYSYVAFK